MTKSLVRITSTLFVVALFASIGLAKEFCEYNNYNHGNNKFGAKDLREFNVAATGRLEVDGRQNGGVTVKGENRNDVLIRACVRSWAASQAEADNLLQTTRIETSPVVRATESGEKNHTSVSYEILVPNRTDLKIDGKNGGIKVEGVSGSMDLNTVNGGIKLGNVSGDIKGRTTNGGISVGLVGGSWNGSGLDVETVNGGIKIQLPANFAANVETGTVNGGFKSDFPELQIKKKEGDRGYYNQNKRVSASINGGGPTVRAITTNGGVKIMRAGVEQ